MVGMSMDKVCKICQYKGSRGKYSLSAHLLEKHSLTMEEYYRVYYFQEGDNQCRVCRAPTAWSERYYRFNTYCGKSCAMKETMNRPENKQKNREHMYKVLEKLHGDKVKSKRSI